MKVSTSKGAELELGGELDHGGRGSVYEVVGDSGVVCKLVKRRARTPGRARKVAREAALGRAAGGSVAWPLESVMQDGEWAGYTMRRVSGRGLDELCRDAGMPLSERMAIASKLCETVCALHGAGVVIGDLSLANAMYDRKRGELALIDADSFQIADSRAGELYPATESRERSPEMDGRRLGEAALTSRSDDYLLAIAVFQLLFDGAHPLDGYESDLPPAESRLSAMRARDFPYVRLVGVAPLNRAGAALAALFTRTFACVPSAAPTAAEYARAIAKGREGGFFACKECGLAYCAPAGAACPGCGAQGRARRERPVCGGAAKGRKRRFAGGMARKKRREGAAFGAGARREEVGSMERLMLIATGFVGAAVLLSVSPEAAQAASDAVGGALGWVETWASPIIEGVARAFFG